MLNPNTVSLVKTLLPVSTAVSPEITWSIRLAMDRREAKGVTYQTLYSPSNVHADEDDQHPLAAVV